MDKTLLQLVAMDYRLAVLFAVVIPLILLIWSVIRQSEAILRLMIIYWRVSSLLMITVYLLIASLPWGFITGFIARLLIPISLWFWVDLNDEIKDLPPSLLKFVVTCWRWAVTVYCLLGAVASAFSLSCAFSTPEQIEKTASCQIWLQAPWQYKIWFHSGSTLGFLGFLGVAGAIVYALYFAYFLFLRLGRQGRSALEQ
jgi:hypothetical protein